MNTVGQACFWRRPAWWVAAAVAVRNADGLRHVRRTLASVDRPTLVNQRLAAVNPMVLHVVVPVLREQLHITGALAWFLPLLRDLPGSTLTFVSTAREDHEREHLAGLISGMTAADLTVRRFPQLTGDELTALVEALAMSGEDSLSLATAAGVLAAFPTTADVLTDELARAPHSAPVVRHVHYRGYGRKAAQVNAAVAELATDSAEEYIAVYDVDSRPSPELLRRTAEFLARRCGEDGDLLRVVQQSARFATLGAAGSWWERSLCRGAARVQTLWTVRREIPNLRRYARSVRRPRTSPVLRGLAQTVGHGLLVRADVFREVGGLPTFTVLDDVAFGYRLTVAGIPVDSLPFTTTVPAAEYLPEVLAQDERWFQSYLDYPKCAIHWHRQGQGSPLNHAVALATGARRGMAWLLVSPATAVCLALALGPRTRLPVRAAATAALWAATVAPVRLLAKAQGERLTVRETAVQSAETLAGLLIKSIGPMTALVRWASTGTRHTVLAPKSNRRTDPLTTDRETP